MLIAEKFPDKMIVVLDYKDFATSNLLYEIENSDFIRASFRLYNKDKELVVYIRSNDDVYYYSSDQWVCCVLLCFMPKNTNYSIIQKCLCKGHFYSIYHKKIEKFKISTNIL